MSSTKLTQAEIDAAETAAAEAWLDQLDLGNVKLDDARYLRRIRAADTKAVKAQVELREAVTEARAHGETWGMIGMVLGVSRQAAQQRFRDVK